MITKTSLEDAIRNFDLVSIKKPMKNINVFVGSTPKQIATYLDTDLTMIETEFDAHTEQKDKANILFFLKERIKRSKHLDHCLIPYPEAFLTEEEQADMVYLLLDQFENTPFSIITTSVVIYMQLRLLVKIGKISNKDVQFVFKNKSIVLDKEGFPSATPNGFFTLIEDLITKVRKDSSYE